MMFYYEKIQTTKLLWLILLIMDCTCLPRLLRDKREGNTHIIMKKLKTIEVLENIPIGHTIIDLKVSLKDKKLADASDANENFYYNFKFISNLNDKYAKHSDIFNLLSTYFLLDPFTGKIQTSKLLDLEHFCDLHVCHGSKSQGSKYCSIPFRIKASKQDTVYHILFDLIIKDVNEFSPQFDQAHMALNVTEEFAPVRLPIGSVAYDSDCTDHNLIYSIQITHINDKLLAEFADNSEEQHSFSELKVITDPANMLLFLYSPKAFDREITQNVKLNVIASDRTDKDKAKTGVLKVNINIADINDNAPRFSNKVYNLEFDEGLEKETKLIQLVAKDPDQGLNGKVSYEFTEMVTNDIRKYFEIDPETGNIILKKMLVYNPISSNKNLWQLSIRASDQSPSLGSRKSSIAIVNFKVNDVNNHRPNINVNFFHMPSLIEPRVLVKKYVNGNNMLDSREEIVYLARRLPSNTIIGLITITDDDADLNGKIEDCKLRLANNLTDTMPIQLEDIESINQLSDTFSYSGDSFLNNEMKFLFNYDLNNLKPQFPNERRYFIRTRLAFNSEISKYEIELSSSDMGKLKKLTTQKEVKLFILNEDNNLISQNDYDYEEYSSDNSVESRLREHIQTHLNDYSSSQYYFSKSIYKVYITEKNLVPIELAKFVPADFEMSSKAKYELIMANQMISNSNFNLSDSSDKLMQCSTKLFNFLSLDESTGSLTLNKPLDQADCSEYLYFIKATDSMQSRFTSMLNFKISVVDIGPKFENRKYTFNVTENIEKTSVNLANIKILNSVEGLKLRIESYSSIRFFALEGQNLVIKRSLDHEKQNQFLFNLVVTQNGIDIDDCLVEINVLDQNEFNPVINKIETSPKLANTVKINKISDDPIYIVTADLVKLLKLNQSFYLNLLRIDARDMDKNSSDISFKIDEIEFFELARESINPRQIDRSQFENLFLVDSDGHLKINLKHLNSNLNRVIPSMVFFKLKLSDKGSPLPLETIVHLKLILNNGFSAAWMKKLQVSLIEKYSLQPVFYLKSIKQSDTVTHEKSKFQWLKELFKQTQLPVVIVSVLLVILVIALSSLIFISIAYSMSVCKIFNCNALKNRKKKFINVSEKEQTGNLKEFDDDETEETEETEDDEESDGLDVDGDHIDSSLSEKIDFQSNILNKDSIQNRLSSWFCSSQKCDHRHCFAIEGKKQQLSVKRTYKKSSGSLQKNNRNGSLFLDSPITVKKILESQDYEAQKNYANKYNLEYLLEQDDDYVRHNFDKPPIDTGQQYNTNTIFYNENKNMSILKPELDNLNTDTSTKNQQKNRLFKKNLFCTNNKKLSFSDTVQNRTIQNSSSEFDDDYILPGHKDMHANLKNFKYVEAGHVDGNILKRQELAMSQHDYITYKKAHLQPEENIWVKKMPYQSTVKNQSNLKNHIEVSI